VLRDVSERVIVASKGRFDRARDQRRRAAEGLPHESTLAADDFVALTLDIWSIPPESARRVGHPAPFPVELPEQLIRLYTYRDDLVLDPFMGSGSALVAAARLGRRYIGYDLDAGYVELARRRVAEALAEPAADASRDHLPSAARLAEEALSVAGFHVTGRKRRVAAAGVTVDLVATDATGTTWYFLVAGAAATRRGGMVSNEVTWRTLGRLAALRGARPETPVVVLTTQPPSAASDGGAALRATGTDVVDLLSTEGRNLLERYAAGT
jgi:site-specific DNA-methyltransferase (adenine-specific)